MLDCFPVGHGYCLPGEFRGGKTLTGHHEDRGYAALDAHALLSLLASKLEAAPSSHQDGFLISGLKFVGIVWGP